MNECCFMAYQQLCSFSAHMLELKNNKGGIPKLKNLEYINGGKTV